jgi:hypothetical protein
MEILRLVDGEIERACLVPGWGMAAGPVVIAIAIVIVSESAATGRRR